MNKKGIIGLYILLISLIMVNVVSASFEYANHSVDEQYYPEENLKGWLNISFEDEEINNIITASSDFSGSISLIDFLNKNSADYSCIPQDCKDDYSVSSSQTEKSFNLNYGKEKLLAFVLDGNIKSVESLSFSVEVNNPVSCINPLEIDILDDDSVEWKSKKVSGSYECIYEGGKGCFDSSEDLSEVYIGETPYCENISLRTSEKFRLGAWVKRGSTDWDSQLLEMQLYSQDGEELESCFLPQPSTAGGEVYCEVEYSNQEIKGYYVCIKADEITDYVIKTESENPCGFYDYPPADENTELHDYYIFAKGARFSNIGTFTFNQEEYENQDNLGDLAEEIGDYIEARYDNDCEEDCAIPVRFKSYGSLSINVLNLSLSYSTGGGIQTPKTKIYDADKTSALITTDYIELNLEYLNITVPEDFGDYDLQLYLNDIEILPEEEGIEVENVPIIESISPTIVAAGVSSKFIVGVKKPAGRNITSYYWEFDDDETEETTKNYVIHRYSSIGNYDLKIEIEDNLGFKSSKEFEITVKSPEKLINSTIQDYKKRLDNLTVQISSFPTWYKTILEKKINIDDLNDELNVLERKYGYASSDDEYVEIMSNLSDMEVPHNIKEGKKGSMSFFVDSDEIKPSYFEELGAGSYEAEEEQAYKEAITIWTEENLYLNLNFKHISAYYDVEIKDLIGIFTLEINSEDSIDELYILIEETEIEFDSKDYKTKEFSDATGISLENIKTKDLKFAVSDVKVEDLVVYLSPRFSQIEVQRIEPCNFNERCEKDLGENWRNCRNDCKPWGWVITLLVIIIFVALIIYILLQWWYKYKYESSLFKNRNSIYNILNFISNAKSQGIFEGEIKKKLRKYGWSGEQLGYVFKKFEGKAIMPFDFVKLFKHKFPKIKKSMCIFWISG